MEKRLCLASILSFAGCGFLDSLPREPGTYVCETATDCPQTAPVCRDGGCTRCDYVPADAAAAACQQRQQGAAGGKLLCVNKASGYDIPGGCMSCLSSGDCASGQGCWHGRCLAACNRHAECEGQTCLSATDLGDGTDAPWGQGLCVPKEEIIYVDGSRDCKSGTGKMDAPFCKIGHAFLQAPTEMMSLSPQLATRAPRLIVHVEPYQVSYGPLDLPSFPPQATTGAPIILVGSDDGVRWPILGSDAGQAGLSVGGAMNVTLEGFSIEGSYRGVSCTSDQGQAALRFHHGRVIDSLREGATVRRCSLRLERSIIRGNRHGALAFEEDSSYVISESLIAENTSEGAVVQFDPESSGTFKFNTVVNNIAGPSGTVACGALARQLESSIIVSNTQSQVGGSQLTGRCTLQNVVVGVGDSAPGAIALRPDFYDAQVRGDYRLRPDTPANRQCCLDRAGTEQRRDNNGIRRPQGSGNDIGAYESVVLPF